MVVELNNQSDSWIMHLQNQSEKPIEKSVDQLLSAFSTSEKILNHSGGTGLGLAVIQGILNLFGGSIKISTENQVFDIEITLPKKEL